MIASKSPQRYNLLSQIVSINKIEICKSTSPEEKREGESPHERARRLAEEKAVDVFQRQEFGDTIEFIIGADTEIFCKDDDGTTKLIGHPTSASEAEADLLQLRGKEHYAVTGIAVIGVNPATGQLELESDCVETTVKFGPADEKQIAAYVATDEPLHRAGAYAIQGLGELFIEKIDGSYSNVVGLPLERLSDIFADTFKRPIWTFNDVSSWREPEPIKGMKLAQLTKRDFYDIVALGDVNMDTVIEKPLPFKFESLVANGVMSWEKIEDIPGGSGLNFSARAIEAGYSPFLISRVGHDFSGEAITLWLEARGIAHLKNWNTPGGTGKSVIAYDSNNVRLLVNNNQNVNRELTVDDINTCENIIATCKVLYISGYCIADFASPRFAAALQAIEHAKWAKGGNANGRPVIVFDVVPHALYEKLSWQRFRECTKYVDILISDVSTMRRFMGLGSKDETVNAELTLTTGEKLMAEKHYKVLALRFGPSGCDQEIIWNGAKSELRPTGYSSAVEKRGFGDRLALQMLKDLKVL